jgi:Zn-dependent oligopeptidase
MMLICMQVLDALMATRHKLALALGFESYAHRAFTDKMMRSPDEASHIFNRYSCQALRTYVCPAA